MLSQLSVLAHKVGDRSFHLLCDPNSPIHEIKEALFQFSKYIANLEDQIKAQEPIKKPEESLPVTDEVKQE